MLSQEQGPDQKGIIKQHLRFERTRGAAPQLNQLRRPQLDLKFSDDKNAQYRQKRPQTGAVTEAVAIPIIRPSAPDRLHLTLVH